MVSLTFNAVLVVLPLSFYLSAAFNNKCLLNDRTLTPPTRDAPTTFMAQCPEWVIKTTDDVWNSPESRDPTLRNASLVKHFYSNWTSTSSWGGTKHGMSALKDLVASTLVAFPDLQIHITDVFCYGNDIDGYKTVMPDVLIGTNTGPSGYGPATGRKVVYSGTAVTYVQRVNGEWQYIAEWLLHDEWSLLQQLGFDNLKDVPHPNLAAEPHDCIANTPGFGWHPPAELPSVVNEIALEVTTAPHVEAGVSSVGDPIAKAIITQMDAYISAHTACYNWSAWSADQRPFWTQDMSYDTVYSPLPGILGNSTGLREWYDHEHVPFNRGFKEVKFNQMIFVGEDTTATTTTYANAMWYGDFGGIAHSGKTVVIRICDFYRMEGTKIRINWMMLDMVDLMLQAGHRVLPKPVLQEGWVQPPQTMDGIPAPYSAFVNPQDTMEAKKLVTEILESEWQLQNASGAFWAPGLIWYGPIGFGVARGVDEYLTHFLKPLHAAFATVDLQVEVLTCEGKFCGAHGYFHAIHVGEWLGQAATNKKVSLRFGMHWHVDLAQKKVVEGYAMFDLPAAFLQMGVNLFDRMNTTSKVL